MASSPCPRRVDGLKDPEGALHGVGLDTDHEYGLIKICVELLDLVGAAERLVKERSRCSICLYDVGCGSG